MFLFGHVPDTRPPCPEKAARRAAQLVELAAIGMDMARQTKADFDMAETPAERREAMGEFANVARMVQRAIFLEAKLEREDRVEARVLAREAALGVREAVQRRKARVEGVLQQVIDLTHEDDFERHEEASESLRWRLDDSFLDRDFADKPIDQVIRAICKGLGVPAPGPIEDDTNLWAIGLRAEPVPRPEPDIDDDDLDDDDGLDPFGRRPPVASSA